MARLVSVMGVSGTGKSSSFFPNEDVGIQGLDPMETFIINIAGKDLPARGVNRMYPPNVKPSEGGRRIDIFRPEQILQIIQFIDQNRPDIKNLVIDDK